MDRLRDTVARVIIIASVIIIIVFLTAPSSSASGTLGDWTKNRRVLSEDSRFLRAQTGGIWLYGDSITAADARDLAVRLGAHGLVTAVDATPGIPTTPAVDRLAERVARQGSPDVLVLATGSNDIFAPTALGSQTGRVRSVVGPETEIVWVDVYVKRWSKTAAVQSADLANSQRVNGYIHTAPADVVVGWYGFLLAKSTRPAVYLRDGVHTTESGRAARNVLIERAVLAVR